MYDQFVGMVATGRHMDADKVRQLADGRAYTGRQALQLGLIDAIGGEPEARAWLASEKGVSGRSAGRGRLAPTASPSGRFGAQLGPMLGRSWKTLISQWVSLDGAWALWQRSRR